MRFSRLVVVTGGTALLSACAQVLPWQPAPAAAAPLSEVEAAEPAEADAAEPEASAPALSTAQNAPAPAPDPTVPQPPELDAPAAISAAQNAPAPPPDPPSPQPLETEAAEPVLPAQAAPQEDPATIQPSPEQIAAAIAMLQSQAAEPENGIDPASDKKLPGAPAKPKRTPDDATPRQPARRSAPGVQVRPLPASHTRPEDTPPPPALYPAEQRGLRSPTLPKLLPMDLDGKIHS